MSSFHFILIDDNELDLFINSRLLTLSGLASSIQTFESAEEGLEFINNEADNMPQSILLLDLQMPGMNGFEFVDAYSDLKEECWNKIRIYILSSTVDRRDIERVRQHPFIIDIISKPLDIGLLQEKLENE